jgi:pimeloyl-ACP methyl ester carboxylesterase
MGAIERGLFLGRVPFLKGGAGPKTVAVFFGANALFRRIDRMNTGRYAGAVERLLPRGYRFFILGYEENPPEDYGFERIVEDSARILREHVGRAAAVMGISFGGFVAQRLAAGHPELVDRLVLLVAAHRFSDEGRRRVAGQLEHLRRGDLAALVRENALLFRRPWLNALVRLRLWMRRGRLGEGFNDPAAIARAYERLLTGAEFERNAEFAGRVRAPALVVGGTRDPFFHEAAFRETAARIPGGRCELFPGETHMLPVERPGAVARVVRGFLGV